jgi:hypothetical protein
MVSRKVVSAERVVKMTTGTMLAIFEDFNEPSGDPVPVLADDLSPVADETGQMREEAWTDGYMTGRHESGNPNGDQTLTARLLTSVYELEAKTSGVVDAAALVLADLLINTVIAVTSDEWSARLLERVRMVADRIKPALTVAPEFELRDAGGMVRRFGDISELSRALDGGDAGQDVSIRWQRGEATISRKALLEDLREAIIPLTAGLTPNLNNQLIIRQHT